MSFWAVELGLFSQQKAEDLTYEVQHADRRSGQDLGKLDINIRHPQRIAFNELPLRRHLIAHEHGEHLVRLNRVVDLHLRQRVPGRVRGGIPLLFGFDSHRLL